MRGGGITTKLVSVCTVISIIAALTGVVAAGPAQALGRPQDRWAKHRQTRLEGERRRNALTGVLEQIWRAQQEKAAAALEEKVASNPNTTSAGSEPQRAHVSRNRVSPAAVASTSAAAAKASVGGAESPQIASVAAKVRDSRQPAAAPARGLPARASSPTPLRVAASGKTGEGANRATAVPQAKPVLHKENPPMARRPATTQRAAHTLRVLTGKSLIIDLAKDAKRVSVANPEVAEVMIISPRQVMVNGLEDGETSIIIWDHAGHYAMYNLVVGAALDEQVMLEVTVAELNRTELERHGVDIRTMGGQFGAITQYGSVAPLSGTHPPSQGEPLFPFGLGSGITWGVVDLKNDITALFKQLQDNGMAKILAEPKLLARSGEPANFLSGGEIPIVITQDQNTTIEFKEFGTKIEFIPTVREDGSIDLKVKSEVSEPDFSQGLQLFGFTVPAFVTRRVDTNVTLGDSQSLIVAGLMKEKKHEQEAKMPFVGDIPLLGYLFRHTEYSKDVLELVIVVKPRLVAPIGEGEAVALPTDRGPLTRDEVRTKREDEKVSRPRPF